MKPLFFLYASHKAPRFILEFIHRQGIMNVLLRLHIPIPQFYAYVKLSIIIIEYAS